MPRIKINRIKPQTVPVYSPTGEYLGDVNQYEFNDLRVQIKQNKCDGYYAMFNNQKIDISNSGRLRNYPKGFFDLFSDQLDKLIF